MRVEMEENDGSAQLNMAPMIDCVFLLLIYFLVATTLGKTHKQLELELAESRASEKNKTLEVMLVLAVDRNGIVHLEAEPLTTEGLRRLLRERARKNPSQRVRIDGDRRVAYQHIVYLMDLCQFEGLRNIGVRTRDDE